VNVNDNDQLFANERCVVDGCEDPVEVATREEKPEGDHIYFCRRHADHWKAGA